MADHYLQTIALLDAHEDMAREIEALYAAPVVDDLPEPGVVRPPESYRRIEALRTRQGALLRLARIHADLAAAQIVAQAIRDSHAGAAL